VAVHPLKPATRRRLGKPLPHQQADRPRAPLEAEACKQRRPLIQSPCEAWTTSGISPDFSGLSPTSRQVAHVLRTRSPLYSPPEGDFLVRLACMKHAANVRPEPGSNSPLKKTVNCAMQFILQQEPKSYPVSASHTCFQRTYAQRRAKEKI
jgi:hypothetical protein